MESADHNALQPLIDLFGVPEQAFLILHPLEIADRDAAGIGQNVWQDGDSAARARFAEHLHRRRVQRERERTFALRTIYGSVATRVDHDVRSDSIQGRGYR